MKTIIAGSRDFSDYQRLATVLDARLGIKPITRVLSGMARGADLMGRSWALRKGIRVDEYPAEWKKYGKAAGFMRNSAMGMDAEALVAFWDGKSKGTLDMIEQAKRIGLDVQVERF